MTTTNEMMESVIIHAREVVEKHPSLKEEIEDLLELCESEIEAGESATHEIELCFGSIDELVEEL